MNALKKYNIHAVMHFSASAHVQNSFDNTSPLFENNFALFP